MRHAQTTLGVRRVLERLLHVQRDRQGSIDLAASAHASATPSRRSRTLSNRSLIEILEVCSAITAPPRGSTDPPPAAEEQRRMSNVVAELDASDHAMRSSLPKCGRHTRTLFSAVRS